MKTSHFITLADGSKVKAYNGQISCLPSLTLESVPIPVSHSPFNKDSISKPKSILIVQQPSSLTLFIYMTGV